jgi:16S rRNA (cytosine1402-N4)-methyltransferase
MNVPGQPHHAVLLTEAVTALITDPAGCYIDATFGRGGHSRAILTRLETAGRLLAIDRDPEAVKAAEMLSGDPRFAIESGEFSQLGRFVAERGWRGEVSGILLDLGVSSPQLDSAERGFSFLHDGPLDMRMNPAQGASAAEWLAEAQEKDIADVLWRYGDERFSRRMARAIVREREISAITRTAQLAKIIADANPAWEKGKHPATRAFQAIRIYTNRELDELELVLSQALDCLGVGGRLVVISFHSLEDRMVKRFFRDQARGDNLPRSVPVTADQLQRRMKAPAKAVKASMEEVAGNPRARSAILRVAEKIA